MSSYKPATHGTNHVHMAPNIMYCSTYVRHSTNVVQQTTSSEHTWCNVGETGTREVCSSGSTDATQHKYQNIT